MDKIEKHIEKLGYKLPEAPVPVASYVLGVKLDNGLLYVSGQTAVENGETLYRGKVGDTVTVEQAYDASKICALRLISEVKAVLGDLERVERIVKVNGYINAAPDFGQHPMVMNGASEFLEAVFGEKGKHARTAVGVGSLPDNAPVEVEMIVAFQ